MTRNLFRVYHLKAISLIYYERFMRRFSLSHHPPGILCLQHQQLLLKSVSLPDKMTRYVKAIFEKCGMFLICVLCKILGKLSGIHSPTTQVL